MLRLRNIVLGSLLVWQLGCSGSTPPSTPLKTPSPNIFISPATAAMGSPDLTITITGSQQFSFTGAFHKFNQAVWSANGSDTTLATTFVSGSQITAIVPAALLTSPAQVKVHVEIWDVQGDAPIATSSSVPFQVTSTPIATPSISSISPSTVAAGSADVTITINGSNFGHYRHFIWSTAFWTTNGNLHDTGTWLQTTIVSSSQLIAVVPARLLQSPNSVQIVVMNGDVMGMSDGFFGYPESNAVTFTVTQQRRGTETHSELCVNCSALRAAIQMFDCPWEVKSNF